MNNGARLPEVTVFAGPNGSGKSTIQEISRYGKTNYVNADVISAVMGCSNEEAANLADGMRENFLAQGADFSFETVLSTPAKLKLLKRAKEKGYFIRGFFILTVADDLNVMRVESRVGGGGHPVPEDKIRSRYQKAIANIPAFVDLCDICHIYDNSLTAPIRIFRKKKGESIYFSNSVWSRAQVSKLVNMPIGKRQAAKPKDNETRER